MDEPPAVTVRQAAEQLGLELCTGEGALDRPIAGAQVCDLLSQVMAQGRAGQLWITIQTHPNTVAVAALAGLSAIVIADGFEPQDETVARAEEENLPLLTSGESAYTLAGRLYELGVH